MNKQDKFSAVRRHANVAATGAVVNLGTTKVRTYVGLTMDVKSINGVAPSGCKVVLQSTLDGVTWVDNAIVNETALALTTSAQNGTLALGTFPVAGVIDFRALVSELTLGTSKGLSINLAGVRAANLAALDGIQP